MLIVSVSFQSLISTLSKQYGFSFLRQYLCIQAGLAFAFCVLGLWAPGMATFYPSVQLNISMYVHLLVTT